MTSIITYSDFTGDLRLDITADSGEASQITLYIVQLQEELLMKLFGRNLYASLDVTQTPAKLTELITAQSTYYTYEGYKYKYPGLKRLLTAYVYFKWNASNSSQPTPEGETRSTNANGEIVYNFEKQIFAWNEMVRLYYEVVTYINYKNSVSADYFEDFEYEEMNEINPFGI